MHSWQPLGSCIQVRIKPSAILKRTFIYCQLKRLCENKEKRGQKLSISCRKEFIYPIEASFYFSGLGNFFCLMLNNINPDDYEGEATGGESEKCPT